MKLSIVIPCYNEEQTLSSIVTSVLGLNSTNMSVEVVIVDDCSSDGSRKVAEQLATEYPGVKLVAHPTNRGKGASLRTGFLEATGDMVGIQDADNEYDPQDYLKLVKPIADGRADVVYGSRYLPSGERRVLRHWHTSMNRFLTLLSNMCSDLSISDMATCYKLFSRDVIQQIAPLLREERFGFEPEVTALVARGMRTKGWRVFECPVRYKPRTFMEGKKIGWKDGIRAVWCILKYNLLMRGGIDDQK